MTGNRSTYRPSLPHLDPYSFAFHYDRLHFEINSCENTNQGHFLLASWVAGIYLPADINNDFEARRTENRLTYRWDVRSVEFVVRESAQNASFSYTRIPDKQNFKQVIVTFRHVPTSSFRGSQPLIAIQVLS